MRRWLATAVGLAMLTCTATAAADFPTEPKCIGAAGDCEGIFLKSAGAPVAKITDTKKGGLVTLTAPGSVTSKSLTVPVACGESNCVFNHWEWGISSTQPVAVKKGCARNTPTCTVKVPRGGHSWRPIVVALNDYPAQIFLLHRSAAGKVVLSGTVYEQQCAKTGCSNFDLVPAKRVAVGVTGKGPSQERSTTADGQFAFEVPKGKHVVRVHGEDGIAEPGRREVHASSDVGGLDFTLCAPPEGATGKAPGCKYAEVKGRLVDGEGKAYFSADGKTPLVAIDTFDIAVTDNDGRFTLLAPIGAHTLLAVDNHATAQQAVTLTKKGITGLRMVLPPIVYVQPNPEFIAINANGLLLHPPLSKFTYSLTQTGAMTAGCTTTATGYLEPFGTEIRIATAFLKPTSYDHFCAGPSTITVSDPQGVAVAHTDFTVPHS